jgi:hypothetical protein
VDEQQGLPARAALRQPRLDVHAAIVQLDLVLAHRSAVRRRVLGAGEDLVGGRLGHGVITIRAG